MRKIRVLLVDDRRLYRHSLKSLLNRNRAVEVINECDSIEEIPEEWESLEIKPDVLLWSTSQPILNGSEQVTRLCRQHPDFRCVVLRHSNSPESIAESISMGASAYLDTDTSPAELIRAIREVYEEGIYHTKQVTEVLLQRLYGKKETPKTLQVNNLTLVDKRVMHLICEELTNEEIASALGKSRRTVESVRKRCMEKIGARNTAGVVKYAIQSGLFNPYKYA